MIIDELARMYLHAWNFCICGFYVLVFDEAWLMKTLKLKNAFIPLDKIVMCQVAKWDSGWKLEIIMSNCTCYVDHDSEEKAIENMQKIKEAIEDL